MKKQKPRKKKKQLNQRYFKKIVSLSHDSAETENKISETMKQWNKVLLFLFTLLLPAQLGKHFFFNFSYLSGIRVDYLAPTLYLTDILTLLLIFLNVKTVFNFFRQTKILVLLSLLILNILLSRSVPLAVYRFIKILELMAIFIIFRQRKISYKYLLSGFLIGGVFELFLSSAQFVNKHSLQGIFYFLGERYLSLSLPGIAKSAFNGKEILRPYGTFSHPNSLAGFYLLLYFFVLTQTKRIISVFNRFQLFSTAPLLTCSLLIFLSFSKVAIITYLFLNLVYLWKSTLFKSCKFCFLARIFILSTVSLVFLQAVNDQFSLQKRVYLMQNAFVIIGQRLLFGVGLGNYLLAQEQFPQRFADFLHQPVHNIFLLMLSETGIVFLLAVFVLYFNQIKILIVRFPYLFLVIIITGLFDHYWLTLQQNFLLIGVILGLL